MNFSVNQNTARAIAGQRIASHDTGVFDLQDYVQTGRRVGTQLNAEQASELAQKRPGAELIVRTSGPSPHPFKNTDLKQNPLEKYDVYTVSVVNRKGIPVPDKGIEALTQGAMEKAVEFMPELTNRFENPQTGLTPAGITFSSSDNQLIDIGFDGGEVDQQQFYRF